MQEAPPPPVRRLAQHHQFAGVDLRRPKGYAAAPEPEAVKVAEAGAAGDPCPRCASRETKFCYYNNYNTAQPRHFCKGCRRYWTKGGTLRNVPVGGGTRKKPSSSSSAAAADADSSRPPKAKKKPASKKRRVVAPAPEPVPVAAGAATVPIAAENSAKATTTTTTTTTTAADGASEVTTEIPAAALEEDSLAHLLLQPGSGADDAAAVALGLGFSDFASAGAGAGGKAVLDEDSFEWPAAFNLEDTCGASATAGGSFVDQDPALLFLNLP